ncbi:Uncharacterized protein QJS10_CPA05g01363 [Acorus calamus]|uniref:MORF/ORRM1/DAG-like MORF domain-containing protein n=1 Tax=Acorus calamus TaxID=4465 RepID=A0AAV9EUY6_ACOCL|nr:Uncharacterized protein QJS10_CPA05g01363 [Acorus calamus]
MALARGRTLITTASHSRWLSLTRTTSTSVHRLHPSFTSPTDLRLPLPPSSSSVRLYSVRPPNHGAANPPIRTMALDGCDYEHWNVVMWPPDGDPSRDEIIDGYVKTLAQVLGSAVEETTAHIILECGIARQTWSLICSATGFVRVLSSLDGLWESRRRLKRRGDRSATGKISQSFIPAVVWTLWITRLPRVRCVLPDSYSDKKIKDYGGEPFLDGKAVPYDPKYHKGWVEDNNEDDNDQNEMDGEGTESNNILHNADQLRNLDRQKQYVQDHEDQKKNDHPPPTSNQENRNNDGDTTKPHFPSQEIHIQDGQCTLSVKNQDAVGHGEQGTSPTSNQELQNSNERSTMPPTLDQELKDINGGGSITTHLPHQEWQNNDSQSATPFNHISQNYGARNTYNVGNTWSDMSSCMGLPNLGAVQNGDGSLPDTSYSRRAKLNRDTTTKANISNGNILKSGGGGMPDMDYKNQLPRGDYHNNRTVSGYYQPPKPNQEFQNFDGMRRLPSKDGHQVPNQNFQRHDVRNTASANMGRATSREVPPPNWDMPYRDPHRRDTRHWSDRDHIPRGEGECPNQMSKGYHQNHMAPSGGMPYWTYGNQIPRWYDQNYHGQSTMPPGFSSPVPYEGFQDHSMWNTFSPTWGVCMFFVPVACMAGGFPRWPTPNMCAMPPYWVPPNMGGMPDGYGGFPSRDAPYRDSQSKNEGMQQRGSRESQYFHRQSTPPPPFQKQSSDT